MSKGLGKRQRAILATLADHEAFWLRSMLGPSCTKAEYNALHRAALKLEAAGLIEIDRWQWHGIFGAKQTKGKLAVKRVGTPPLHRDSVLSVGQVPCGNIANTYPPTGPRTPDESRRTFSRHLRDMADAIDAEIIREEVIPEGRKEGKTA